MLHEFWSEGLKGRDHFEDLGVDGMIILELMLGKWGGEVYVVYASDSGQGTVAGSREHCNEPSGSKKRNFLDG